MAIDDAYRTLGITRGAAQADAFAAYREQSSQLAGEPEQVVVALNRAYEVVTQDIWRHAQLAADDVPMGDEDAATPKPREPWKAVEKRPTSRRRVVVLTLGLVVAGLATVLVVAPSIGREEDVGWSEEDKADAIESCTVSGGREATCRCIIGELTAMMTPEELIRVANDSFADGRVPQALAPTLRYCAANS